MITDGFQQPAQAGQDVLAGFLGCPQVGLPAPLPAASTFGGRSSKKTSSGPERLRASSTAW